MMSLFQSTEMDIWLRAWKISVCLTEQRCISTITPRHNFMPFLHLDWKSIHWLECLRLKSIEDFCVFFQTGTAVAQAQAQHPDGNRNGITYTIFSGNKYKSFSISSSTGQMGNQYKRMDLINMHELIWIRVIKTIDLCTSQHCVCFHRWNLGR